MTETFSRSARLMGIESATVILVVGGVYAAALTLGLAKLATPQTPIGNPYFTAMEVLILMLAPTMVSLMAAVHAWAPQDRKALSLAALSFVAMLAAVTCSVHFLIVTLSGQPGFTEPAVANAFLAFRWPSVVYALDILGWDIFFALAMLFAAPVFVGGGIHRAIRSGMIVSGVLALAGLLGVALNDMAIRNIGIAGYLGVFLILDCLLLVLFLRQPVAAGTGK